MAYFFKLNDVYFAFQSSSIMGGQTLSFVYQLLIICAKILRIQSSVKNMGLVVRVTIAVFEKFLFYLLHLLTMLQMFIRCLVILNNVYI